MPAERAITVGRQRIVITCMAATADECVCVCSRMRERACMRMSACVMRVQYKIIFDSG